MRDPPASDAMPERSVRAPTRGTVSVRPGAASDLPAVTEIYNHYVVHSPCTFDLTPLQPAERVAWWSEFRPTGRHRAFVAVQDDRVVGYALSHAFRPRPAYDTTIETSVYCAPDACGQGIGAALYARLFDALRDEDVELALAGFTLPNPGSEALHRRFGFRPVGVFHRCGRKFGRYWDVQWNERPMRAPAGTGAEKRG